MSRLHLIVHTQPNWIIYDQEEEKEEKKSKQIVIANIKMAMLNKKVAYFQGKRIGQKRNALK